MLHTTRTLWLETELHLCCKQFFAILTLAASFAANNCVRFFSFFFAVLILAANSCDCARFSCFWCMQVTD